MQTARLSLQQARRLAVRATGLDRTTRPRPARVDVRHLRRVVQDVDVVQLDSVNVLARAHHLVFHARLGPHDTATLDDWLWRSREVHECWAHVASMMSMDAWPLLAHRRETHATHPWRGVQRLVDERPDEVARVLDEVARRGPLSVAEFGDAGSRGDGFWGWGTAKKVLHWLFLAGHTAVDHRDRSFMASWDLPERVVPPEVLTARPLPRDQAIAALALRAVRAQGVATAASAADHHRQPVRDVTTALAGLAARGEVTEVRVDELGAPAWIAADAVIPRTVRAQALVAPFDPLVWFRRRVQRLFGMHYRVEIYVPAARRQYGYYVLPFLLDDQLVARVDLKADRASRRLLVRGAWAQPGQDRSRVARHLVEELRSLALFTVGRDELEVVANGDLSGPLAAVA